MAHKINKAVIEAYTAPKHEVVRCRLRFRNDMLNSILGGGLYGKTITEISGSPSSFKSTLAAELAVDAYAMGGIVAYFNSEPKDVFQRFATLGMPLDLNSDRLMLFDHVPAPGKEDSMDLTIENINRKMTEIHIYARERDRHSVQSRILQEEEEVYNRYKDLLGKETGKLTPGRCKKLVEKISAGSLHSIDKTMIFYVIDSVTAVPAEGESYQYDAKKDEHHQYDLNPAGRAKAWSDSLRSRGWGDEATIVFCTAQIRTHLDMRGGHSYERSSVSKALEFYATNRLRVFSGRNDSKIRRSNDGGYTIGSDTSDKRDLPVIGDIIDINIDKSDAGISGVKIPALMLNLSGTDKISSLWYYLQRMNVVAHHATGKYKFIDSVFSRFFNPEEVRFDLRDFMEIYIHQGSKLAEAVKAHVNFIKSGVLPLVADPQVLVEKEEPADPPPAEEGDPVEPEKISLPPVPKKPEDANPEVVKKKPGRPKKPVDPNAAPVEKRKPGRPKKPVDPNAPIPEKRKPGRPKKIVDPNAPVPEKRKPGRPKKIVE